MIETSGPTWRSCCSPQGCFRRWSSAIAGASSRSCRRSCCTYLFVTALAVGGVWSPTGEMQSAQRMLTAHLLPALLFLLMVTCDLRAILQVGPRVLAVFACAMGSILLVDRRRLPAVSRCVARGRLEDARGAERNVDRRLRQPGRREADHRPVAKARCRRCCWPMRSATRCGCWCCSPARAFAPTFNRWTRSDATAVSGTGAVRRPSQPMPAAFCCGSGIALVVGLGAAQLAMSMPVSTMLTTTSWTVLIATLAGLIVARTPLARIAGPAPLASALLAMLVAVLGVAKQLSRAWRPRRCSFCAALLALAAPHRAARAGGARVPFRSSAVRHFVAGADRRRRVRAGAGRDLFADPGADRGAARHARVDPGHGHGPVHGERAVGAGAGDGGMRDASI